MTGGRSTRRRPARIAGITAVAFGATLVIATSASAAISARSHDAAGRSAGTARARTGQAIAAHAGAAMPGPDITARGSGGRSLRTLFGVVRVFDSSRKRGWVKGKITRRGTGVSVTCWTTGSFYKDSPIWYEVSAPLAGYVSAFDLAAHYSPAVGVPHCLAPVFKERFNALEANLRIRSQPSTAATIAGYLAAVGSRVSIECYVKGTAVFGDPIWYRSKSPAVGFVAGRLLNTGGDPAPGVPRC